MRTCKKCKTQYPKSSACPPCRKIYIDKYYNENKERYKERSDEWYKNNRERKLYTSNLRHNKPEVIAKRHSEENKKKAREFNKTLDRRAKLTERQRLRAKKIRMDSLGLTEQEKRVTHFIYKASNLLSKIMGVEYHVDHKIPLSKGGVHHPSNLQIMLGIDNMRKNDRI